MSGEVFGDSWREHAACRGKAHLFFGYSGAEVQQAKALCRACPVIGECRQEWFKARRDTGHSLPGVWFGTHENDRRFGRVPTDASDAYDRAIREARVRLGVAS